MEEFINFSEELSNRGYVFPVVEADAFVDNLLPPLRDGINAKRVKSILKKKGYIDSRGRWKGLWSVSEGKKRKKYDTFAPLLDIFEKAASVASEEAPHLEQMLEMTVIPESVKGRPWRNKSSQTACFSLKQGQSGMTGRKEASWLDIALTAGFRRIGNDTSRKRNVRKIISNIQLAMARDPSRRFSFGITVENTTMRLWFCSRASPVVSTPFDFSRDVDTVLRIFLSLAFATKEELGWDPTMRPFIRSDGTCVYRIDVNGETYETREILSSSSADQLLGHATRVWKVRRLSSNEPESESGGGSFVLKDVWIEDDREPEHSLLDRLLNDVEEKYGPEIRRKLARHLVTPIAHCFVGVDEEEDHTTEVMMRGYTPSYKEKYRVNVEHLGCSDDYGEDEDGAGPRTEIGLKGLGRDGLRDPFHWYNPVRKVPRRRHYRVVFEEVAKSMNALRDLEDVFTVLSDIPKALRWIHGAGWVHCDLSAGNLYLYEGRGLIGDFEYAKQKDAGAEDERLIGTREFLAIEAAGRCYLHLPRESKSFVDACGKALEERRWEDLTRLQNSNLPPPFFYNDLHDLESLWWIAIWKVMNLSANSDTTSLGTGPNERSEHQEAAKNTLFPRTDKAIERELFLQTNVHFRDYLAWMQFDDLKRLLNDVRKALVDKYSKFEATFPDIQMQLFDGTHSLVRGLFRRCKECIREAKLRSSWKSDLNYQRMKSRASRYKRPLYAACQQVEWENTTGACYHPSPGLQCENCIPRQAKRKYERDSIDDGYSMRPVRRARIPPALI